MPSDVTLSLVRHDSSPTEKYTFSSDQSFNSKVVLQSQWLWNAEKYYSQLTNWLCTTCMLEIKQQKVVKFWMPLLFDKILTHTHNFDYLIKLNYPVQLLTIVLFCNISLAINSWILFIHCIFLIAAMIYF